MAYKNKEDQKAARKRHYEANKAKEVARSAHYKKIQVQRLHEHILDYLNSNPCVECGEGDPIVLEFDHISRESKDRAVSRLVQDGVSIERLQVEIDKCQVLCCNCHRRRTYIQLNRTNKG